MTPPFFTASFSSARRRGCAMGAAAFPGPFPPECVRPSRPPPGLGPGTGRQCQRGRPAVREASCATSWPMRVILKAVCLTMSATPAEVAVAGFGQRSAHHAGAGNADVDYAVRFAGAVEGAGHKGVVLRGVAEYHQLGCADAVAVGCAFGCFRRMMAPIIFHSIHIDAGLGGADIDRGADEFGVSQRLRNAGSISA